MDERTRRLLNPTKTIVSHLPLIIEAFVEFYGEEERENITKKFKNMVLIGYISKMNIELITETANDEKSKEELQPYKEYLTTLEEHKNSIRLSYQKELLEAYKDLFTEEEYLEIQRRNYALNGYEQQDINKKIENNIIAQKGSALIEAFDIVNNSKMKKYPFSPLAGSIKKDRIRYFKNLGIDLGDNYNKYLKNSRCQKMIPSIITIEKIKKFREQTTKKFELEYYSSYPYHEEYLKNINKEEQSLLFKCYSIEELLSCNSSNCVSPGLKIENEKYVEYPIVIISTEFMNSHLDTIMIHELNHLYELKIKNIDLENKRCTYSSGFETPTSNVKESNKENGITEEKKSTKVFSEIINELIAQEISSILSGKLDCYVFDIKGHKEIKNGTKYERTRFLAEEFYENYKKEIIEARKNGDMEILYRAVGKENFDALNRLFVIFNEKIDPKMDQMSMSLTNEEIDKKVKSLPIYKVLMLKKEIILAKMAEHYKSQAKVR